MSRQIFITHTDKKKLLELIAKSKEFSPGNTEYIKSLEQELERAQQVASINIPPDVITMNSKVLLKDKKSGDEMIFTIVYPDDADINENKISVLAPIGTAILGFSKGDIIDWKIPDGFVQLEVLDILYQPEAAGIFDL